MGKFHTIISTRCRFATLEPTDVLLLEPDEQDELLRLVGKIAELKSGTDKPKGAIDV